MLEKSLEFSNNAPVEHNLNYLKKLSKNFSEAFEGAVKADAQYWQLDIEK